HPGACDRRDAVLRGTDAVGDRRADRDLADARLPPAAASARHDARPARDDGGGPAVSTVRLTMPAKAEYLILVRLALAGIAREVPMSESVLADLKLAVTEVCGNAVRHAYGDAQGEVHVVFDVSPEAIDVTVEDDGHGMH